MDHDIHTLTILAEVTIAFIALAAIVASLRMTLGEELSPFQRLLVHFFTESGLLVVSVALLPLVLAGFWQDELTVARIANAYAFVVISTYLVTYIRRRIKINAPTPFASLVVMISTIFIFSFFESTFTTSSGKSILSSITFPGIVLLELLASIVF